MKRPLATFWTDARGQVALLAGVGALAIAVCVGASVDLGRMNHETTRLQDMADAAALRAVIALRDSGDDAEARRTASSELAPGVMATTTVVDRQSPAVTVALRERFELMFGGVLGAPSVDLARQATATASTGQPICMLVLDPTGTNTFSLIGSPDVHAPNCLVQVNSSSPNALHLQGSPSLTARATHVSGRGQNPGHTRPAPVFSAPAVADPLASRVTWPAAGSCTRTDTVVGRGPAVLSPGVYCGGLRFGGGSVATLLPGVYVVQSGHLTFDPRSTVLGPLGVTFVLLDPEGVVTMQANAQASWSAPTSGPWRGIGLAVKPQPTRQTSHLQGGADLAIQGIVYMPTQALTLQGNNTISAAPTLRSFVVSTFGMQGSGRLDLAGDPGLMATPSGARISR